MSILKKIAILFTMVGVVGLVATASAFGWGVSNLVADKEQSKDEDARDHRGRRHHRSVYHGGYYRPYYGRSGARGRSGGGGGFRGGK